MHYTISQLAQMAHVSTRTLRYYHQIGLLVPGGRSDGGQRKYTKDDLQKLQQILFFKELNY